MAIKSPSPSRSPHPVVALKRELKIRLLADLFWEYYYDSFNINGKVANRKLLLELKRRANILA